MSGSQPAFAPDELMFPQADGRARAYHAARRHSSLVRALRIGIPAAFVLGAAGFAAVSWLNPFARLPGLTLGPISLSGSKVTMEGPRLTGFRQDARPYEVTATAAYQDIRKPNVIELKDMRAKLAVDAEGHMASLVSAGGVFDTTKEQLELSHEIRISTDRGEHAELRSASVDFKAGTVVSREPVRIATPSLVLEAGGMEIGENGKTLSFTGRVQAQILRPLNDRPARPQAPAASPRVSQAGPSERQRGDTR